MAAVMTTPRFEYEDDCRAPARPHLVLVDEPRAVVRRSPRTTQATYWRRRLAVAVMAIGLVVVAGKAATALGGTPLATSERRPPTTEHVVTEGDTLWSIVERLAPGADPRPLVDDLVAARGGSDLVAGERIELPQ
ncbi:MAG TPA: hypothetical protein VFF40_02260 [Acidimicrobiia bacterium]|nr:hypothetical protein [Acidimicrobiia bacterium]